MDKTHLFTTEYFRNFVRIGRKLAISVQNEKFLNKQLETVLDAVHEGIISIDANGIITVFNEDAIQILGVKQENIIGKHFSEIVRDLHIEEVMGRTKEIPRQVIQIQGLQILITKTPIVVDQIFSGAVITFQDVSHVMRMEQEIRRKKIDSGMHTRYTFDDIVGKSNAIEQTKAIAKKLARSEYTILIHGESGTGKEIFAQAIHEYSSRKQGPFVAVNFAGITQSLAESELFGYDDGAFTGARRGGKAGLFELAQNGTIFLDEIGDAPPNIQAAILRVLQERQVMRVGSSKVTPVNVRVIAATNRDLQQMMSEGTFREDLFYRLNQLPLEVLPLRERVEDINTLMDYFLDERNIEMRFSPELRNKLFDYHWPGNIRELEAMIRYLTVAADGVEADLEHLPPQMKKDLIPNQQAELTVQMLRAQGDSHIYRSILEILRLYQQQKSGIGRGVLLSMMDKEVSEAQLRTKLETLRQCGCISVGVKKTRNKNYKTGLTSILPIIILG
ncbi:sigma 54-interacting transcriptional regulator [Virgibacillus halophilus]|uniref:Sigma 54-interacting transcriptional regulator n=1 Tax=Tigheibacillus halophilus TaxID=361280 RepID=A0ABU5C2M7_9BACI|nr:sigma 54-interacting transcriptional regulator [Virgibacillus halophilus]